MQGSVHQLSLTGEDAGLPHPHVVVLTFSGNRDCIVVPAYSEEGHKVGEYIKQCRREAMRDEQIFVRLDTSEAIDLVEDFPGKVALWCPGRFRRLAQKTVTESKRVGQMRVPALLCVSETLLNYANFNSSAFSLSAFKALRNSIGALRSIAAVP